MWVALLLFTLQLSPPAHVRLVADVATVTSLTAVHRGGQTFLTGTKNAGSSGSTTYAIRRSASTITSSSDGTLIATLDANSYRLLDDDSAITDGQNLTSGLIVTDDGAHLGSTKIFVVVTTGLAETGTWHYAAFTSDDPTTVAAGVNTTSVAETYQAVPGAIHLNSSVVGSYTVHRYMLWENLTNWVTGDFGYYGHRFNVMVPTSGSGPWPLILYLHAAQTAYHEPQAGWNGPQAVAIYPVELDYTGGTNPYTGTGLGTSKWQVRFHTSADLWKTCTEDRLIRITKMVRDNLTGDSVNFNINSNRLYVYGASQGSGAMHVASHYPDLFAAAGSSIGWLDNASWGFGGDWSTYASKKVNSSGGLTLTNHLDIAYYAQTIVLPPMIYMFSAADTTISPAHYTTDLPLFETYHQGYFAEWRNTDHQEFDPGSYTQWSPNNGGGYLRFYLNEGYPAFGAASTSTTVPTFPGAFAGQRNGTIDWQGGGHTISGGSALSDTSGAFAISLISSSSATGVTCTIQNAQSFLPSAAATVTWSTSNGQSGSATRNADSSVTIASLTIPTSAMRLTFTSTEPGHFGSGFAGAIR